MGECVSKEKEEATDEQRRSSNEQTKSKRKEEAAAATTRRKNKSKKSCKWKGKKSTTTKATTSKLDEHEQHDSNDTESNPPTPKSTWSSTSNNSQSNTNTNANTNVNANGSKQNGVNRKKVEEVFKKYADGEECIGPDGVAQLCTDLKVEPDDVVMLVFAWHLRASEMGYFKRAEFVGGLEELRVESIERLSERMNELREELKEESKFKQIYEFAFKFSKEQDARTLEMDLAIGLLELLLVPCFELAREFVEFVQEGTKAYRAMNNDQWKSLLEFCSTMSDGEGKMKEGMMEKYDIGGSWPVMIDEFVEWKRTRAATTATTKTNADDE